MIGDEEGEEGGGADDGVERFPGALCRLFPTGNVVVWCRFVQKPDGNEQGVLDELGHESVRRSHSPKRV